jgi:hypothetical protein
VVVLEVPGDRVRAGVEALLGQADPQVHDQLDHLLGQRGGRGDGSA